MVIIADNFSDPTKISFLLFVFLTSYFRPLTSNIDFLFQPSDFILHLRSARFFKEPHQRETGNKIKTRQDLFNKVENTTKSTLPATECFVEDQGRNRRPQYIAKFTQHWNGIGGVTYQIHQNAKDQGNVFLRFVHAVNLITTKMNYYSNEL
jgi:hypothetical protein